MESLHFCGNLQMQAQIDSTMKYEISYAIRCPIWYHLYNFKNVKNKWYQIARNFCNQNLQIDIANAKLLGVISIKIKENTVQASS